MEANLLKAQTRDHALLSASSSERWLNCPPSARIEDSLPDSTSEYAEEGTRAHAVAELVLAAALVHSIPDKEHLPEDKEMVEYAHDFASYVIDIKARYDKSPLILQEVTVDYSHIAPEGFGTIDVLMVAEGDLHIIDYKYGRGVAVSAERNSQLMLYALGALKDYNFVYNVSRVFLHIFQPRINNSDCYEISVRDLSKWGVAITPIAQLAYNGEGDFKQGEHCRFCKIKGSCKARSEQLLAVKELTDKVQLSNEELGEVLQQAKHLAKWASDLEEEALGRLMTGEDIKGWKVVEGRSVRQWTNADEAFKVLIDNGTEEALLYERKMLTLAQAEKVVGKAKFNELVGSYVVVPEGKPTLVEESDKRQSLKKIQVLKDFS